MAAIMFERDQEVYATDGRVGLYVSEYYGEHIVTPIFDHDEMTGEPLFGPPELWRNVFSAPPIARMETEVATLTEKATRLRAEVEELAAEKRDAERSRKSTLAKLAQHRTLERIEDFIEGRRLPLVVIVGGYGAPVLRTVEEATKLDDRYTRETKLMTLFGKPDGDLEWRINQYHDGSGSWTTVYPVATEDEARALVREMYAGHLKEWRKEGCKSWHPAIEWAKGLPVGWVEIPDDVRTEIRETALKSLRSREAEQAAALSSTQASIAAIVGSER